MPPPTSAQHLSINDAISRLADTNDHDRLSFLEALFKFITWLRWPTKIEDHPAAITVCVISYLSQMHSAVTLDQLDEVDLKLVHRHLRLDTLQTLFSDAIFAMPSFVPWTFDGQRYDRSDLLADIAWFLLAYEPPTRDPRDAPGLAKAYYATQNKLFKHKWRGSHRTFRTLWLAYGVSSPFHYVERFHPTLEFTLDPSQPDFAQSVNELLEHRTALRPYFSRCKAAVELLLQRLDRRAAQALRFPTFPDDLPAESIIPPSLPPLTRAIMSAFRVSSNPLRSR